MPSCGSQLRRLTTVGCLTLFATLGVCNRVEARQLIMRDDPLSASADQQNPQNPQDQEQGDDPYARFLTRLTVDALWTPGQIDAGMYGLIGMHIAIAKVGRLYVFGPPGVLLVVENTPRGRLLRPGFTWGISYSLTDVRMPGTRRETQLYLTLGRCWVTGSYSNGLNMVGLSLTWKK
jgi:hypothetical protein